MNYKNKILASLSVFVILLALGIGSSVNAAGSPSLGMSETYGILSSTYVNTAAGTTINGDLGYTTGPAVSPTVNGTTHVADGTYAQAGIDQLAALALLNNEPCTHTFPAGAVDLAANVDFPTATYIPGVYCITGAASIGTGGITLNGSGTYIFRMVGALNIGANSVVTRSGGASTCDVWWTPTAATTFGANSTFGGTVIDNAGITVGANVTWTGRALSSAGTISTDVDTITVPTCTVPPPAPSATLTLTKTVINNDGGVKTISDFPLFVDGTRVTSGVATTTLSPGTYVASETPDSGYAAGLWGGDCAADGTVTLADGDNKECTITNDDNAVTSPKHSGGHGHSSHISSLPLSAPSQESSITTSTPNSIITISTINNVFIPKLPNTGIGPNN